jgi:hypothetical protein
MEQETCLGEETGQTHKTRFVVTIIDLSKFKVTELYRTEGFAKLNSQGAVDLELSRERKYGKSHLSI